MWMENRTVCKKIAICAFSGYVHFPRRFERAVKEMEKYFDAVVYNDLTDSSIEKRVQHFHDFLEDDSVEAIISLTGGYNSNEILPYLDYDLIKRKNKPIIGFSDTTAVQLAILAKSGIRSYYGPSVLFDFGSFDGLSPFTLKSLDDALKKEEYYLKPPQKISFSNDFWDRDDHKDPVYERNTEPIFITDGCAQTKVRGNLVGGNLNTLLAILGTEYMPKLDNAIVFLEDFDTCPNKLTRDMHTLLQAGFFENANGILLSKFFTDTKNADNRQEFLNQIFRLQRLLKLPFVANMDFGHYLPRHTIPINSQAEIDLVNETIKIINK